MSTTAETLLDKLKDEPSKNSAGLVERLTEVARGRQTDLAEANSIFNEVFLALSMDSQSVQEVATSAQRELAEALGADESKDISLQDWLAQSNYQAVSLQDRINLDIARLENEFGSVSAQPYVIRLEKIMGHAGASHQRMMADTLSIDLAKDFNYRKKKASLMLQLDAAA